MNLKNHIIDTKQTDIIYDFLFIGLGASNSLALIALLKNSAFLGKKIAIIEQSEKNENDKTYCFWAQPNDNIVLDLAPIISHRYDFLRVNQSLLQNIQNQPYYYIRSIDFYNYTLEQVIHLAIPIFREQVSNISEDIANYVIQTNKGSVQAKYVFDSRPPLNQTLGKNDIFLHQSFYGLHIRFSRDVFQKDAFDMMNFNVEQHNYTQFIYLLPFSSREALIELTRFGAEKIDVDYAKEILHEQLINEYGDYEVVGDEIGSIPMTTFVNKPNASKGIINMGASANLIKPSTGYAFKNMYDNAQRLAENIKKLDKTDTTKLNHSVKPSKKRFLFYDRLLLIILLCWPHEGKRIFSRLYKRQSIQTIFLFLDEKTSLFQEIKIFASLPVLPFLKALLIYIKQESFIRYVLAILATCIFWLFDFSNQYTGLVSNLVLLVGFLYVGIPHGALDHLLLKKKDSSVFFFVLKYLLIIALYFALWYYLTLVSLILFILFSSFHFGESEYEEAKKKTTDIFHYVRNFMLGLSLLLFIILTHVNEAITIIADLKALHPALLTFLSHPFYPLAFSILSISYIAFEAFRHGTYSLFGLLLLLLLGIKAPLIFAFGLYFIFQHSFNAWGHLQLGLNMNAISLYQKALPYTIGALGIFIGLLMFLSNTAIDTTTIISTMFIFLACISLPHFILMHLFYKPKK
jgi:lycopene beta-cyclase